MQKLASLTSSLADVVAEVSGIQARTAWYGIEVAEHTSRRPHVALNGCRFEVGFDAERLDIYREAGQVARRFLLRGVATVFFYKVNVGYTFRRDTGFGAEGSPGKVPEDALDGLWR